MIKVRQRDHLNTSSQEIKRTRSNQVPYVGEPKKNVFGVRRPGVYLAGRSGRFGKKETKLQLSICNLQVTDFDESPGPRNTYFKRVFFRDRNTLRFSRILQAAWRGRDGGERDWVGEGA